MFEKIIALDSSEFGASALPHVAAVAQAKDSPVTLLRVLETHHIRSTAVDPLTWNLAKAQAQAHLDETAHQLSQLGLPTKTVLLEGGAVEQVVEYVHKQHADLLVLSGFGQGEGGHWDISGIAQKVVYHAGTSIMLVRSAMENGGNHHYRRILAPLDGSQRAEWILPFASALAERDDTELLLVHVVQRPAMMERVPLSPEDAELVERIVERNQAEAEKYLTQLQSRLPANTQIRTLVADSVTQALHQFVEQEQIDLVVLSAHGRGCDHLRPFSTLVNNFITYGDTSLLILQDLSIDEIESLRSEQAQVKEEIAMPSRSAFIEGQPEETAHSPV